MQLRARRLLVLGCAASMSLAGCGGGSGAASAPPVPLAPVAPSSSAARETSSAQSIPFAATPDPDPFYAQPAAFPNARPGTILASRPATYAPDALTQPNPAWQLKFVSRDINDKPIAAVATVVKPLVPFAGGTQPLLSVQYYENSLGSQCAPSHSVTGGTSNYPSDTEGSFPLQGLSQGMTLVFPDHLGPNTEYAVGLLHGQITLDGIRAALAFAPLGLNAKSPVGMEGYSGGAIATAWAAGIQKKYAPELNVVAIASGGTPAKLKGVFKSFDTGAGNALFSIGLDALLGINRAYPKFITPILNAKGVAAANSLKNGCGGNTSDGSANPTGHFADYTTSADPIDLPSVDQVLQRVSLPQPGQTPIAPMFMYHSQVDELVPITDTDGLVSTWCAQGVHIAYYRGAQGEHVGFDATMAPAVFQYLRSRFSGQGDLTPPGTTTCN